MVENTHMFMLLAVNLATALSYRGGVLNVESSIVKLSASNFTQNRATDGGVGYINSNSKVSVTESDFFANRGNIGGGILYVIKYL